MQRIPEDATPTEVRDGIVSEVERVEADERVASLAPPYRKKVDEFQALHAQIDPLLLRWIREDARLVVRDAVQDDAVKAFRLHLVKESGNKQTGPLFDRFLPEGLRDVTEAEMTIVEPAKVKHIIDKLTAAGGDLAAEWVPKLTAPRDAVVAQAGVRHGIELEAKNLDVRLDAKVIELQEARVELHALLRVYFKDAPERAEAYFFQWQKPRRRRRAGPAGTPGVGGGDGAGSPPA